MQRHPFRWVGLVLALVLLAGLAAGQPGGAKWDVLNKDGTGGFIVALAQDLSGNIWVGTEDKGLFRYTPSPLGGEGRGEGKGTWTQFTSKNGLADDNAYAIACDKLGRVWVGTLNHGVSVFSGERGESSPRCWKNYDVLDGPIGERIFAITTCPTDGDVWMATSAGLTRYSLKTDSWSYVTRADGLAEDQANAIAFDPQGNIYVGTQCHGIAMAKADDEYKKWTTVPGPGVQLPVTPNGTGLPTSLINGLIVSREGTIFAATTAGLAWSKDKGKSWNYLRGKDYAAKVKGRWGGAPAGWKEAPKQVMDTLLPEDYVTCVAEDDTGLIWVGFRQHGYVAIDPKTSKHVFEGNKKLEGLPDDYVFTILPTADSRPGIGTYGGGLARAKSAMKGPGAKGPAAGLKPPEKSAPLPAAAKPPTLGELKSKIEEIQKASSAKPTALSGLLLPDDWKTQGNFYGADKLRDYRYGEWHAHLCAFGAPFDSAWGRKGVPVAGRLGTNRTKDDSLRHWIHSENTDNVRCLKNPFDGGRRQSEWDDHGEAYPMSHEGPHVYVTVLMPAGSFYLSFYIMNKDGHEGHNRFRDFLITVKSSGETDTEFARAPVVAQGRVKDFWGGVYKVFAVKGGQTYTIQIHDNWSFNTIVSGVFIDPIIDPPELRKRMADIPRVRYSFQQEEAEEVRKLAAGQQGSGPHQALGLIGELQQWRSNAPLAFAGEARRTALLGNRAIPADPPSGIGKDMVRRAQAECLNEIRLYDQRDSHYQAIQKP